MININDVKKNVDKLSKSLNIKIDSIFVEQRGNIDKVFYDKEELHELRSCSKLLVSMAIGIAIERKFLVLGEFLSLDTKIYPIIENIVDIRNEDNLEKIKKWKIKDMLTHTAGYEEQMMSESFIKNINKDKLLDYALNYNISYEPGIRYAYNNAESFILSVFFKKHLL